MTLFESLRDDLKFQPKTFSRKLNVDRKKIYVVKILKLVKNLNSLKNPLESFPDSKIDSRWPNAV